MRDRVEILEATLNLMEEGVVILGENEEVLLWNKAAAAVTGYQSEELTGQRCPEHLFRVDEALFRERYEKMRTGYLTTVLSTVAISQPWRIA